MDVFVWEAIPAAQSFDAWTNMFAWTAEFPLTGEVGGYMAGQVTVYQQACEFVRFQEARTITDSSKLFVVYCQSYKDNPQVGEIGVYRMQKLQKTLVKHYRLFRVPAFDLESGVSPLPLEEVGRAIATVAALKLTKVP